MKELFSLDMHDYNVNGKVFSRPSVRGVVIKDDKVLLVHSVKYDYYKFPGGGMEKGETHTETLLREVLEETGFPVIKESIREFGFVMRKQKDSKDENGIFVQENYYYFCELNEEGKIGTNLDDYEAEEGFTTVWMRPDEASRINYNCDFSREGVDEGLVTREAKVLEILALEMKKNAAD